ncbi:hypothetical protein AB7M70_010096 [Bradyrhizobium japonicum]
MIDMVTALAAIYEENTQPTSSLAIESVAWMCGSAAFGIEMLTACM